MIRSEVSAILDGPCALGSGHTLKISRRHGLEVEAFGVKYSDLEKRAKRLKKSPELAPELWASGNHDASYIGTIWLRREGNGGARSVKHLEVR